MDKTKILIVEDEAINSLNMQDILERKGYEIIGIAQSGPEAIKLSSEKNPDLMLVDIILQGKMDGIETVEKIKLTHSIPFVYLTAHFDDNTLNRAKATEPYGYIIKPISENDLYSSVQVALYKNDMERKLKESEANYKKLYEKSKREEELYISLLNSSPDSIVIYDLTGNVLYASPSFTEVFGWTFGEIKGKRIDFVPESEKEKSISAIMDLINKGTICRNFETKRYTKDKRIIDINISASRYNDHEGNTSGILTIHRDISEENRIRAQLQQSQKMEAIGTLAGGIAHDFNNILSAIIGYTQMSLGKISVGHPLYKNLNQIQKASFRARDLVEHILNFSRRHARELKPVRLNLLIDETLKLVKATFPSTIKIQKEITSKSSIILGDSSQVHQVLMNFCTNAQDAMRDKGGILALKLDHTEIGMDETNIFPGLKPGPYLKLVISDTGHGMDSGTMERIFEPFYTTKEKRSGTGMGLSTAHGIVKSHGGIIDVKSELGKGSSFEVYFPSINAVVDARDVETGTLPAGDERLLFIDDEEVISEMVKEMLEQIGYNVKIMGSPIDAIETFRDEPDNFDMVITDMTMPGIMGDKLSMELLRIRPDIPIILCTGYSEHMSRKKALSIGIREFLMKPVDIKKLAITIRNVLDG